MHHVSLACHALLHCASTRCASFASIVHRIAFAGESISEEEMREMIEEADRDHDGYVTFEDFFRIMKKKSSNPLDDLDDDEDF